MKNVITKLEKEYEHLYQPNNHIIGIQVHKKSIFSTQENIIEICKGHNSQFLSTKSMSCS